MSRQNVEVVQAIYERWQRGDFSSVDWADPEIEYTAVGALDETTYRGPEAMADAWADWLRAFDDFHVGAAEFHDAGDQVVAINYFGGSGHSSGIPIEETRGAARFTIRDGKVVELAIYLDANRALRDAGIGR